MTRPERLARAVKRYAETVEPPFRQPGWIAQTAASLDQAHPLAGVFQQAAQDKTPIIGSSQSSGWRPWQEGEDFSPIDYYNPAKGIDDPTYREWRGRGMPKYGKPEPEAHDIGDGVTASVIRKPLEGSPGYERVHVALKHEPTGRTGQFVINRKVQ